MELARYALAHFFRSKRFADSILRANKMDSYWPWVFFGISAPAMATKQFLNVIQMVKASKWLAEGDLEERRKAKAKAR